ncbi:MAG TPA: DUF6452 family protein [Chitinophagaceae bacterium]|jgi:hypothetical protein|nr:DUF6452 family protein [Chitinophagaceae bacterium]
MQLRGIQYLFIGIVACLCFSCEDYKDCNSPVATSLGIHFYHLVDGVERDSILPALTMYGIGRSDSLLADTAAVDRLYVPLNPNADSTGFFLQPDSTMAHGDTLTVAYTHSLQFVSSGCGFTTFYDIDTVYYTTHYIDSIAVPTKKIITTNATNLKIYY